MTETTALTISNERFQCGRFLSAINAASRCPGGIDEKIELLRSKISLEGWELKNEDSLRYLLKKDKLPIVIHVCDVSYGVNKDKYPIVHIGKIIYRDEKPLDDVHLKILLSTLNAYYPQLRYVMTVMKQMELPKLQLYEAHRDEYEKDMIWYVNDCLKTKYKSMQDIEDAYKQQAGKKIYSSSDEHIYKLLDMGEIYSWDNKPNTNYNLNFYQFVVKAGILIQ